MSYHSNQRKRQARISIFMFYRNCKFSINTCKVQVLNYSKVRTKVACSFEML